MAPAFTRPGYADAVILLFGWVQTGGVHAVTEALVAAGVAGKRHHEAFHRFFSRGTWSPDTLGRLLSSAPCCRRRCSPRCRPPTSSAEPASVEFVATVYRTPNSYAGRWSTEACFCDLKQHLGVADPQSRKRAAVERTAPFVGSTYTTLVVWFAEEHVWQSPLAAPPQRPWYHHKAGLCFQDILRCAQRVMPELDVLDPAGSLARVLEAPANHPFAAAHAA